MDMDPEFSGIWAHIAKHSPLPERDAICRLIGIRFIDDNQSLWRESQALKSIIVEMADNGKKYLNSTDFSRSKSTGKRAISDAKNFSTVYYNNVDDNVAVSPEAEKLFSTPKFTYEAILSSFVTDIRTALEFEHIELEREIARLNKEMDNQSESVFQFDPPMETKQQQHEANLRHRNGSTETSSGDTAAAADSSQQYCRLCNKRVSPTRDPPAILSSASLGSLLSVGRRSAASDLCVDCTELRARREAKLGGGGASSSSSSTSSQHMAQRQQQQQQAREQPAVMTDRMARMSVSPLPLTTLNIAASHNNRDDNNSGSQNNQMSSENSSATATPRSGSHGGTTSRFRSRLNTARDELFLSDDF